MTDLTVIILTRDEARHITRAIASVSDIATRILVVDSGSTDETVALADAAGAEVLFNPWVNYATQFNWALDQIAGTPGWVLRLDADEVVTPELAGEIAAGLPDRSGLTVPRRIKFMGQTVRFGGVGGLRMLRLFRNGAGRCEARWMDEHIVVAGAVGQLHGAIVDDNQKSLNWWIEKHNGYAGREAVDLLNQTYRFLPQGDDAQSVGQAGIKRWVKLHLYARLPGGLRAGLYFLYRYILRLGILDHAQARRFHVLQGFWYRYLVDAKLAEVLRHMTATGADAPTAVKAVLGIDVGATSRARAA